MLTSGPNTFQMCPWMSYTSIKHVKHVCKLKKMSSLGNFPWKSMIMQYLTQKLLNSLAVSTIDSGHLAEQSIYPDMNYLCLVALCLCVSTVICIDSA